MAGIFLIKTIYLIFASILFIRFLSFRSQQVFETMVESYNRLSAKPWEGERRGFKDLHKYLFYIGLIVLCSSDFLCVWRWGERSFEASLILDTSIWILGLAWVARAYRLKAEGLKERLKEVLDNARSRRRSEEEPEAETVNARPFLTLGLSALAATLLVSGLRWRHAEVAFRVDDLKECMEAGFKGAMETYYHQGRLEERVSSLPCLSARDGELRARLGLHGAEPYLKTEERETSDFFGNGISGDEVLELGIDGRFRLSRMQ